MRAAAEWFQRRLPIDTDGLRGFGAEPVPEHLKSWWWCLGGTAAYLFIVQVVTGILLAFHYVPDPNQAYESVQRITEVVPFGWYIRSLHRWSSNFMIVAVFLHLLRVFFTGAYRPPRELNWLIGCGLLLVTMLFGFTGYSLVYEQLSFWGATVAGNITESVPLVGPILADFIRGGERGGGSHSYPLLRLPHRAAAHGCFPSPRGPLHPDPSAGSHRVQVQGERGLQPCGKDVSVLSRPLPH